MSEGSRSNHSLDEAKETIFLSGQGNEAQDGDSQVRALTLALERHHSDVSSASCITHSHSPPCTHLTGHLQRVDLFPLLGQGLVHAAQVVTHHA